jgi:hypothetical protein
VISVAVFVIAWLPPVIEQLQPGTGNLRKLYDTFSDPSEPFVGARASVKAIVGRFNLFGAVDRRRAQGPAQHTELHRLLLVRDSRRRVTVVGMETARRVELSLFGGALCPPPFWDWSPPCGSSGRSSST